MKTADSAFRGYFEVSVVKISARSDKVRGRSYVSQSNALHDKPVLRNISHHREKLKVCFLMVLWAVCYVESDDPVDKHVDCALAISILNIT